MVNFSALERLSIYWRQVMMVEETVWEDHETCDHSYDKRCHKSYTTTYTPVQAGPDQTN